LGGRIGGSTRTDDIFEYDAESDTWTLLAVKMPFEASGFAFQPVAL